MTNKISIVIVDDHAIFRQGLRFVLSQIDDFNVIAEACNGSQFINIINDINIDIVLMDISMPEMDGIEATKHALKIKPGLKIITLSTYGEEAYYYKMIKAGVMGFVQKKADIDELEMAIREVAAGGNYFPPNILRKLIVKVSSHGEQSLDSDLVKLTDREKDVLELICQGYSNNEIADTLFISPKTVDNHRTNLLQKTNTRNAANLVMFAIKNKLVNV